MTTLATAAPPDDLQQGLVLYQAALVQTAEQLILGEANVEGAPLATIASQYPIPFAMAVETLERIS